jgi:hypothetical protein
MLSASREVAPNAGDREPCGRDLDDFVSHHPNLTLSHVRRRRDVAGLTAGSARSAS